MKNKTTKALEKVFSVKNELKNGKKMKVVTVLGAKAKFNKEKLSKKIEDLAIKYNPFLREGIPDNLTLQLFFNNDCNCKCKFCAAALATGHHDRQVIPEKWLYEDFLPLYHKTTHLVPTYGEITICKEGYNFLTYIHKNFPYINVSIETNGISFDEKWMNLAADNLMRTNFSINAVNDEYYRKTVWDQSGIFPRIIKNLDAYLKCLKNKKLFAFKPSVSIVIDDTNYLTCVDFIKQHIQRELQVLVIFCNNKYIGCENQVWMEDFFKTLLELERLLKDKVFLNYRLFVPIDNLADLEFQVAKENEQTLREKYADILECVEKLPTLNELYQERTKIRNQFGKKDYSYYEEVTGTTYHQKRYRGNMICANPWTHLKVNPNGDTAPCSWYPTIKDQNLYNYMKKGKIDWESFFDNFYRRYQRYKFQKGCYVNCMHNCPGMQKISDKTFNKKYRV